MDIKGVKQNDTLKVFTFPKSKSAAFLMHNKFSTRMPNNTRRKIQNYTARGGDSVQTILYILIYDMRNQDLFKM